jgi:membrane associated rhomboid family serine protease
MDEHRLSPFNAIPPVVIALAAVIGGLELMFQAATAGFLGGQAGLGWRLAAIEDYGVLTAVVDWMRANNTYPLEHLIRFVTYPLIHGGFVHAAFVIVFILAIGKMVAEVFSPLAFVAVFLLSAIVGALAFTLIMHSQYPLIGGYPGVYGLIGAFTFLLWTRLAGTGAKQYRAFSLIGILLAIQILFGLLQGDFGNVVSELSGFVTGFLLSFIVSPGGWSRAVRRMRQR